MLLNEELMQQLKQLDEITLLELLNVNSEDLVNTFRDRIEDDIERYRVELQQFFPTEEEETET